MEYALGSIRGLRRKHTASIPIADNREYMDLKDIEQVVSEELNVPLEEISHKGDRKPLHVVGRFMVWSLVSYYGLPITVEELGMIFDYHHTTIVDGRASLVKKLRKSIWLRNTFDQIKTKLDNGYKTTSRKVQTSRASNRQRSKRATALLHKNRTRP